ncbi:MAG: dienelactone hydrolase family protein [Actinomycetota bacterium]
MAVLPHEGTFSILYGTQPVPVGTGYQPGYLARPDEAGKFPVVLLLPGLAGLRSAEKDLCRRLARNGFGCLGIELYGGNGAGSTAASYAETTDEECLIGTDESFDYLQSDDVFWAIRETCGIIGVDVGGRFALIAAATRPWVGAVAVASTPLTGDEGRRHQVANFLSHLPTPVLGLYGEADNLIANETIDEAQDRNAHGQWLLYSGAKHDFLDDGHIDYDAGAAADAQTRLVNLFRTALPEAITEDLG